MALTYTTAVVRDAVRERRTARELDTVDLLLAATSLVAILAIGLTYAGKRRAFDVSELRRGSGATIVDLNAVTNAAGLDPALRLVFPDDADRRFAAQHLLQFAGAGSEDRRTLPNVAAILGIEVPVEAIARAPRLVAYAERLQAARDRAAAAGREAPRALRLFTAADLAALKPALAVRTPGAFRRELLSRTALYVLAFAAAALVWRTRAVRGDRLLLALAHLLTALGFAAIVSRPDPIRDTMLFVRYTEGVLAGLAVMIAVSLAGVRHRVRLDVGYVPLIGALALSVLLMLFGHGPGGSRAKVNLGPVQPVEAIRLLLALFLAGYFARRWELLRQVRGRSIRSVQLPSWLELPRAEYVIPVVAGVGAAVAFFFLQRDLGPALLLACLFLPLYAVARGRVAMAAAGALAVAASFYVGYRLNLSDTLVERVRMWQAPWDNGVRGGDQVAQAAWALSTGGTFGAGLGLGDTRYLPAGHTDLVLAAIGEELGAAGVLVVAGLYALLAWRGLRIARAARTDYEFFRAAALTLFLVVPALVMTAGVLGLIPLTGIVTPFLSYGGSAMVANLAALGILAAGRADAPPSAGLEPFRVPIRWLHASLAACGCALVGTLVLVQVVRADDYAVRPHLSLHGDGVRRYQYNPRVLDVVRQIPRGTVYDRRGWPLATDDREVVDRFEDEYRTLGVPLAIACADEDERCYPLGGKAFHLLGDERTRANWSASNTSYVERDAEDSLRGFDDRTTVVQTIDSSGAAVSTVRREYRDLLPLLRHRYDANHSAVRRFLARSRDLRLTIDARLQFRVAEIVARVAERSPNRRAAAVVLDPATGDLLALASYPWPEGGQAPAAGAREAAIGPDALLDRARYGLYPPGSTFKLLTAAAALRRGPSMHRAVFSCSRLPDGRVGARIPGWARPVRDDVLDAEPHGAINMRHGLVRSCNAYFAQLALRLGPDALVDVAAPLGILVAPGNARRRVADTLPQAGYGQGDVLTTPLKMARVAAAFAADGEAHEVGWERRAAPRKKDVLLAPDSARLVSRYLREAVLEGTGRSLRDHPWRIAGKTGTAEVAGAPSHAWFVGFAPHGRAARRIAFAVIVENAGYGGLTAAAAAGEIVSAAAAAGLVH